MYILLCVLPSLNKGFTYLLTSDGGRGGGEDKNKTKKFMQGKMLGKKFMHRGSQRGKNHAKGKGIAIKC